MTRDSRAGTAPENEAHDLLAKARVVFGPLPNAMSGSQHDTLHYEKAREAMKR